VNCSPICYDWQHRKTRLETLAQFDVDIDGVSRQFATPQRTMSLFPRCK